MRGSLGVGAGFTRYQESGYDGRTNTVKTRGVASQLELAIGGSVADNLILHANLVLGLVEDVDNSASRLGGHSGEVSNSLALIGGGVTYYFMPSNVYLSAMVGLAAIDETRSRREVFLSDSGIGGALMVGKEWWVGRHGELGIGVALTWAGLVAYADERRVESNIYGSLLTLAATATLN